MSPRDKVILSNRKKKTYLIRRIAALNEPSQAVRVNSCPLIFGTELNIQSCVDIESGINYSAVVGNKHQMVWRGFHDPLSMRSRQEMELDYYKTG